MSNDRKKHIDSLWESLADYTTTTSMITDRIDDEMLCVMSDKAKKLALHTDMNSEDRLYCALVMGYLLNSQVTRYDIQKVFSE
jgi:hypothetical protein